MVCLGLFTLIITCVRLPLVVHDQSAQPSRTFFASIQLLTSTFVAAMPTIYGRLQNGRRKNAEQMLRRESAPEMWWTSRNSTSKRERPDFQPAQDLEEKASHNDGTTQYQHAVRDIEPA